MNLQDTIYNWLSIKQVSDARPSDHAAKDTYDFFDEILKDDHGIEQIEIEKDEVMYVVNYVKSGEENSFKFPIELIDALLLSIESEPKYNE
jgi:hypothetical protein